MASAPSSPRHEGLDIARFIAFVGMVFINFKVVMVANFDPNHVGFSDLLEGRAAALFVVLAGIGLGLSARRAPPEQTFALTLKRAGFLFVIGLMNSVIFEADILHYYAFYFLIGAFCLALRSWLLAALILLSNLAFVACVFTFDYDQGWDWTELSYQDFWMPMGFIRNLIFNGFHPILPWISFLLLGILISRLDLKSHTTQNRLIWIGFVGYGVIEICSKWLKSTVSEDFRILIETVPIPPMPLYVLAGMCAALFVIGLCLKLTLFFKEAKILKWLSPAGRQTLSLYIAHIILGMGILESLDRIGEQNLIETTIATVLFCSLATLFAYFWAGNFKHGPIEILMRKWAG